MSKLSRASIIAAYNGLVAEKDGKVIGEVVFIREAHIARYHWHGGYWRSWSAFQAEAGHTPNEPSQKTEDETLLRRLAELAVDRKGVPTEADLLLKRKEDPTFPSKGCFRRWGSQEALLSKLAEYCEGKPQFNAVAQILKQGVSGNLDRRLDSLRITGFIYLLRSGKYYKLGRTNAVGRRLRELAIQLPEKPDTVHVIETDDPEGIEQYWHRRFAEKRQEGEWFALSSDDVKAFKKRRFQ